MSELNKIIEYAEKKESESHYLYYLDGRFSKAFVELLWKENKELKEFIRWYSGMEQYKIDNAYKRFEIEHLNKEG
tara:strand:- start:1001 stop:1225 length:225 start_codon:yes stop_codon:yes gene_type:complete